MEEYLMIVKVKSEFQKMLNQWKHQYNFEILWMSANKSGELLETYYHALIKRWKK